MINWFDMPAEGLSNGGEFEVKELEVTENGTYETKGEMYNKVTVNVEGGGGSSDLSIVFLTISSQKNVRFALKNCIQVKGRVGERYIVADDYYAIIPQDGTRVLNIPLIDGYWECEYEIGAGGTLNVVGNGEANDDLISITGDCTITIS